MKVELDLQYFAEMGGIFEGEDSELVKNMNMHMILMHYYAKTCFYGACKQKFEPWSPPY